MRVLQEKQVEAFRDNGAIVAANAVVREGQYEPGLYAGMPAKFKKALVEYGDET